MLQCLCYLIAAEAFACVCRMRSLRRGTQFSRKKCILLETVGTLMDEIPANAPKWHETNIRLQTAGGNCSWHSDPQSEQREPMQLHVRKRQPRPIRPHYYSHLHDTNPAPDWSNAGEAGRPR